MFSSGPNYTKLKTNLRLAINRLKLIEKKKTELAQKSRKEIADYISAGKIERAKIRVEHIIREDYLVEAMEVVEMYCDLLLARFGLLQQTKALDEGLAEAISSILWVAPRLQSDIPEMSMVSDQLTAKYGRQYTEACRDDSIDAISVKLKHKMSVQAPPKILVENYLMEIAKNYNLTYEPDPQVMREEPAEDLLLDLGDKNNLGGGGIPQPAGFIGFPQPPMLPTDFQPFNYPPAGPPHVTSPGTPPNNTGSSSGGASGGNVGGFVVPPPLPSVSPSASFKNNPALLSYNIPPNEDNSNMQDDPPPYSSFPPDFNFNHNKSAPTLPPSHRSFPPDLNFNLNQKDNKPKPAPRAKLSPPSVPSANPSTSSFTLPDLPSVPSGSFPPDESDSKSGGMDDIDFDDLTRRFEELKKKK